MYYLLVNFIGTAVLFAALPAVLIFSLAGRWDLWNVWAYAGILVVAAFCQTLALNSKSSDLLKERTRPATRGRDQSLIIAFNLMFFLQWCITGLDQRFHWSDIIPPAGVMAGLVIVAVGQGLATGAMLVNPFFSLVARIQDDRGQRVITEGPYAIVRHPGYTGFLLWIVASGLALNSLLSIIPAGIAVAIFAVRTAIEDQMLRDGLTGYADYAAKVRYRLMPGVW
jgi:protein-S-isoprenylcysteine O-methyltransferase Ste14